MAAGYLVLLLALSAWSAPRRVGDGGEYVVMALQLADGRPPSVSPAELQQLRAELAAFGPGFESALLDYPGLVSAWSGRQEFLHFFLYPLFVAPVMRLIAVAGAHPNWAFTVVNALLLAAALLIALRHAPVPVAIATFASPIVWWVDKAHTEAFLFAMVTIASVLIRSQPPIALLAFACAGAQNAAIGVTYPAFAAAAWWLARDRRSPALFSAAAGGAAIVAMPFAYSFVQLGRWSPMVEYAETSVPSLRAIAAFLFEPNIGLAVNAWTYLVALGCAMSLVLVRRLRAHAASGWWWPAVIHALLLLAWSQNPNANHGGTPSLNRWTLSLLPLGALWIGDLARGAHTTFRGVLVALVSIAGAWSVLAHVPAVPEAYTSPNRMASAMWRGGLVHLTPAEVFAERAYGGEPPVLPTHDGSCRVLLISYRQAPIHCVPPAVPLPSWCESLCFAVIGPNETRYLRAFDSGFSRTVAPVSWPAGGPLAAGIRQLLQDAGVSATIWRVDDIEPWRVRLGDEVSVVLRASDAVLGYLPRASAQTIERLYAAGPVTLVTLTPYARVTQGGDLQNVAFVMASGASPPGLGK